MKTLTCVLVSLLASLNASAVWAQGSKYPPLSEYMMAPEAEIPLARSAAPEQISAHATVKILTPSGYKLAAQGDNGFVCVVMRGWGAPAFTQVRDRELVYDAKLRAPICFDPVAARTVLPLQELRAALGMQGKDPDAIARDVVMAHALGKLPKMEGVAFAYMWSPHQHLGPGGAFRPHMMIYAPYYDNAMLGGNELGGSAPFVADDAGTLFAVVVVPVDGYSFVPRSAAR